MRIIGGEYRGRVFHPPKGLPVRPTTDQAREAIFNILQHRLDLDGLDVLDAFAGTGSMTYEFYSRGAAAVTAVDRDAGCLDFIRKTLDMLGIHTAAVVRSDVQKFLDKTAGTWDLMFLDPPYALRGMDALVQAAFTRNLLRPDGLLILEHASTDSFERLPWFSEKRTYGGTTFSLFTWNTI